MFEHDGCDGCKYINESEYSVHCIRCTQNAMDNYAPITNADRIRSMTDEELAAWLVDATVCDRVCSEDEYCHGDKCVKLVTNWLQQSAKEAP